MRKLKLLVLGLLSSIVVVTLACASAPAPAPASQTTPKPTASPPPTTTAKPAAASSVSFAGKTITIVVPSTAGGGTDIMVRIYGRYLAPHLPGKPNIIARNMPGGEGTVAANYVFQQSKPDGLTALATSVKVLTSPLVGGSGVRYDLLKMNAVISTSIGGLYYARSNVVAKPEDVVRTSGLVYGAAGGFGAGATGFVTAKELLGIPTKNVVLAYAGTGDAMRAFLSGEVNMGYANAPTYFQTLAPLVQKGEVVSVFQSGIHDEKGGIMRDPALPKDILTIKELYEKLNGKSPSGIVWSVLDSIIAVMFTYQKMMFLPPDTPPAIRQVWGDSVKAMVKDPKFLADPIAGETARWMAGDELDKEFKANYKLSPEAVEWLRDTMGKKYGVTLE